MSSPATEYSTNLKYRLTGAVILIGVAVLVMSGLLNRSDTGSTPMEQEAILPLNDGFVSRIKSTEDGIPEAQSPKPQGDSTHSNGLPGASIRPQEPILQPVLKPDNRLPKPSTRLNTVTKSTQSVKSKPTPQVKPVSKAVASATNTTWVVRVGTFSDANNVTRIVGKLGQSGYKVSTSDVKISGKSMIRVTVGPFVDRRAATLAKSEIAKAYDLNGFVVRQN